MQPSGRQLIVDSIYSLDLSHVRAVIIAVPEHLILDHCVSRYKFEDLFLVLPKSTVAKLRFFYATTSTVDAVDTATSIITSLSITGPIFIKDADNDFKHLVDIGNYLTYLPIIRDQSPTGQSLKLDTRPDLVDATRKSYVSFSYDNIISNIAYGSFVSSQFCCGGWSFLSAEVFVNTATALRDSIRSGTKGSANGDVGGTRENLKILDVLWQLLCDDHLFFGAKVSDYKDWGSCLAWETHANCALSSLD
jgi:hypothetical protein